MTINNKESSVRVAYIVDKEYMPRKVIVTTTGSPEGHVIVFKDP